MYTDSQTGGKIYQCGYREIPWNLHTNDPKIDLVIFAAAECPPLNNFMGDRLEYHPNRDLLYQKGTTQYDELLQNALSAVPSVISAIKKGETVLSTCAAGMNRSGIITALSIKRLNPSLNPKDIISAIQKKRRCGALTNPAFNIMIEEN